MSLAWDRRLWGVEWSHKGETMLIGQAWAELYPSRYAGEPSRPLLFTTRAVCRARCAEKQASYSDRTDFVAKWRFRPIRVRETAKATAGLRLATRKQRTPNTRRDP